MAKSRTRDVEIGSVSEQGLGAQFESAVERRERLADNYDLDFGQDRVFPQLVAAMLAEVPRGTSVLEVGAATGLLTRPLLEHAGAVTAMEPSEGMLRRLLSSDVSEARNLRILQGVVEELPPTVSYDVAVVTFTPRRGLALMRLLTELAVRVCDRVVVLLPDDSSMDWAYLARSAAAQGFGVRLELVHDGEDKRAVVLTATVEGWQPLSSVTDAWAVDAREVCVPYPAPRGFATRIIRYFLSAGDRALSMETDPRGIERLYGNLRTAVHRLARDELTVRRHRDTIQLVRLPRPVDLERDDDAIPWLDQP